LGDTDIRFHSKPEASRSPGQAPQSASGSTRLGGQAPVSQEAAEKPKLEQSTAVVSPARLTVAEGAMVGLSFALGLGLMRAEREVMACIGCNDCLIACPLPESSVVTIAALNAAVLSEQIPEGDVAEFVQSCTQCQQCVPVCPADLHRADMVLWNKMKMQDVAVDREMPLQVDKDIEPSGITFDGLAAAL